MPLAVRRMKVSSYLMLQEWSDSEENIGRASQRSGWDGCRLISVGGAGTGGRCRSAPPKLGWETGGTGKRCWKDWGKVLEDSLAGARVDFRERETRIRGH